jgi:glycine/D-amino acid oxidase-like deaminating enzyme
VSGSPDVVVVGAGARGASVAYYLARAGVRVTLVEKGYLASGTSSMNVGLVNVSGKTPEHYTAFSLLSADMYPKLAGRAGGPPA